MSGDRDIVHPPHLQDGKAATRDLTRAFGGQDAAAELTGRSQSRFSAYGGPNTADFMPIDLVDALEERTQGLPGHPHVTRWLARRRGYGLVKLPDPSGIDTCTRWGLFTSQLAKEAGDVTSGLITALTDDNDVSPEEARGLLKEARELVRIAVNLEHALSRRSTEDRGG